MLSAIEGEKNNDSEHFFKASRARKIRGTARGGKKEKKRKEV